MAEKTLDKLIETLRTEVIEAAEKESDQIIEGARAEAAAILAEVAVQSEEMIKKAEKESKSILDKGRGALDQAARDLNISVRNDLLQLLKSVLGREVQQGFSADVVEKAIGQILENVGIGVSLVLSEELAAELGNKVLDRLHSMSQLKEVQVDKALPDGIVLSHSEQGWSYDISSEAVTELLFYQLSPSWIRMMNKENK